MPSQQRAAYRIVLRGRKGFTKLRYAETYEIYYGKRRVLARRNFPLIYKKVADKKDFLQDLLTAIDRKRKRHLEKQKAKRKRERENARKYEHQKKLRAALRRKLPKFEDQARKDYIEEKYDREYVSERHVSGKALPVFNKVFDVEPATAIRSIVKDTMIIPMAPEGAHFSKQIFDKEMQNRDLGHYHIATLDYTLTENRMIALTAETFKESYHESVQVMLPHILRYFEDTVKSASDFILRIKFLNNWDPDAPYELYGLSDTRQDIRTIEGMIQLFKKTFQLFFGNGMDCANYLQGEKLVFITGFTLEAMVQTN